MSTEQLSAADLLANSVSPAASSLVERLTNVATYTTTALAALAQFHAENGDEVGAKMLSEFAACFAHHEAATL